MIKKKAQPWNMALVYYMLANILMFVPSSIIAVVLNIYVKSIGVYVLLHTVLINLGYYFALRYSGKNIQKNYVVDNVQPIQRWCVGYVIVINSLFIFWTSSSRPTTQIGLLLMILNIVIYTLLVVICTKKFIVPSTPAELEAAGTTAAPEPTKTTVVNTLKFAGLVTAAIILLAFVPVFIFFLLSGSFHMEERVSLVVTLAYEVVGIWLVQKYFFPKK